MSEHETKRPKCINSLCEVLSQSRLLPLSTATFHFPFARGRSSVDSTERTAREADVCHRLPRMFSRAMPRVSSAVAAAWMAASWVKALARTTGARSEQRLWQSKKKKKDEKERKIGEYSGSRPVACNVLLLCVTQITARPTPRRMARNIAWSPAAHVIIS